MWAQVKIGRTVRTPSCVDGRDTVSSNLSNPYLSDGGVDSAEFWGLVVEVYELVVEKI